jgi:LPS O-antigen subunit length determinant protein (WzzB/FepE family)
MPCERIVGASQRYCYAHDPARAEARKRNASKGGRSKPNREILEIKNHLKELTQEVLSGTVATAPYAVANQLINTRLRAVELERKAKETEELEERIERLEEQSAERGGRKWGA